jgi:hypothetical protein
MYIFVTPRLAKTTWEFIMYEELNREIRVLLAKEYEMHVNTDGVFGTEEAMTEIRLEIEQLVIMRKLAENL